MHYTPIKMRWTPSEQRVFALLSERRYAELIKFCKQLVAN